MDDKLTRRDFLESAPALVGAVAALSGAGVSHAGSVSASDKLAILGGTPVRQNPFPETWPIYDQKEEQALLEVLHSRDWCSLRGHWVYDFEKTFADAMGSERSVLSNGGTTALRASLFCAGVGAGDEVITTPNTFIATINTITNWHALPVFVDIDPDTGSIDADRIEAAITEHTKAILPVHLNGFPVHIRRVMAVAEKHGIPVIEDACQSVFAAVGGKKVGTFGDLGCFSFQEWKSLVAGEGGAIIGADGELMRRCAAFVNNGRDPKGDLEGYPFPGSNHRMTEFQAAVLTKQYERFVDQDAKRQENGRYLEAELGKIPGLSPRKRYEPETRFTYVWFEINYDRDYLEGVPAERFAEALRAEGMPFMGGPRRYGDACHREGMLEEHLKTGGFRKAFSAARLKAYRESLSFPVTEGHTESTTEVLEMDSKIPLLGPRADIEGIVEAFRKVARNASALL